MSRRLGARRRADEGGSAALELTLITPALVLVLLFVVLLGRVAEARGEVDGAARDAARTASLARTAAAATGMGEDAADAALSGRRLHCRTLRTVVDIRNFRAGGTVAVDIDCWVQLSDLTRVGLPGTKLVHSRAVAAVDDHRGRA